MSSFRRVFMTVTSPTENTLGTSREIRPMLGKAPKGMFFLFRTDRKELSNGKSII